MSDKSLKPDTGYTKPQRTRELITEAGGGIKQRRLDRDAELKQMVADMDAASDEWHWSWSEVQGKVRVSVSPRG